MQRAGPLLLTHLGAQHGTVQNWAWESIFARGWARAGFNIRASLPALVPATVNQIQHVSRQWKLRIDPHQFRPIIPLCSCSFYNRHAGRNPALRWATVFRDEVPELFLAGRWAQASNLAAVAVSHDVVSPVLAPHETWRSKPNHWTRPLSLVNYKIFREGEET
jgi:hypothetical protein